MLDLLGKKVIHTTYGLGEIVQNNENYIRVKFELKTGEFVIPSVFLNGGLEFESSIDEAIFMPIMKSAYKIEKDKEKISKYIYNQSKEKKQKVKHLEANYLEETTNDYNIEDTGLDSLSDYWNEYHRDDGDYNYD